MTTEEIARLIRRLEQSDLTTLEVSDGASSLSLRLAPGRGMPRASESGFSRLEAAPAGPDRVLRAAAIGRLHLRHPDAADAPGFPRAVAGGEIVAFLEAGGCLRPVLAEADATIGTPLLAEGSVVGFGTPLFPLL